MGLAHSPRIVTSGLVLYLDAANRKSYSGSGNTWTDLSGNDNTGTLTNGPTFDTTNGGSIVFDGTNDYIKINDAASLDVANTNITLEVVYKTSILANQVHGVGLICKGSGSNDGVYEILLVSEGSLNYLYFRCQSRGTYWPKVTGMATNTIYIIHCVMRQGLMLNYINAVQEGTGLQTTGNIVTSVQPITIGTRQLQEGSSASALIGNIYSAKVYNRALSVDEIQQNYAALRGRYGI